MRRNIAFGIAVVVIIIFHYGNLKAQTDVPYGNVSGVWTVAGSPYHILGNIMVPNKSTLTINPGVSVIFKDGSKLFVQGRLIAVGTASDTISFSSENANAGWNGIRFDDTPLNNDTSKISFCKFQYGSALLNAPGDNGGALYFNNSSKVIIENCLITNCKARSFGGGICCVNSSPIIRNTKIINCSAQKGGGIYCYKSSATIKNNNISNNKANLGGGIYCENSFSNISKNTVSYNSTSNQGGGIYCENGNVTIDGNKISFNRTPGDNGGGIYCFNGNTTISNNEVNNNFAGTNGGGIYSQPSTVTKNTIFNNSTEGAGGGIHCAEGSQISDNTIFGNDASSGGGISVWNKSQINNNIIHHNSAVTGGGIDIGGSLGSEELNPTVTGNEISYNAASSGGGISVTLSKAKVIRNKICNNTALTLQGNNGGGVGGGIYCFGEDYTKFVNNVIANNSAINGGGIYLTQSIPTFINNTITFNEAGKGGALYCNVNTDPDFFNTIIFGNSATLLGSQLFLNTEECDPKFYFCDVEGGMEAFEVNMNFYTGAYEDNIDSNPLFVSPPEGSGNNFNGLKADWSLHRNSGCINTGDPNANYDLLDIAGNSRLVGDRIDMGAYEFQNTNSTVIPISKNTFVFYPNPAHDRIVISEIYNGIVEVIDVKGQIVNTVHVLNSNNIIDLSGLPNGFYSIKVTTEKGIRINKMIKQ